MTKKQNTVFNDTDRFQFPALDSKKGGLSPFQGKHTTSKYTS